MKSRCDPYGQCQTEGGPFHKARHVQGQYYVLEAHKHALMDSLLVQSPPWGLR